MTKAIKQEILELTLGKNGHLLREIILVSVKQVSREYQAYEDIEYRKRPDIPPQDRNNSF